MNNSAREGSFVLRRKNFFESEVPINSPFFLLPARQFFHPLRLVARFLHLQDALEPLFPGGAVAFKSFFQILVNN